MTKFFEALTAALSFGTLVFKARTEKDEALKRAKEELLKEWKLVHASNDIVLINRFLGRVRKQ